MGGLLGREVHAPGGIAALFGSSGPISHDIHGLAKVNYSSLTHLAEVPSTHGQSSAFVNLCLLDIGRRMVTVPSRWFRRAGMQRHVRGSNGAHGPHVHSGHYNQGSNCS